MKYEADHQGNVVRVWDDDGKLIYATRANWGIEADRRNSHIPHKFGTYYRTGLLRDIAEARRKGRT